MCFTAEPGGFLLKIHQFNDIFLANYLIIKIIVMPHLMLSSLNSTLSMDTKGVSGGVGVVGVVG